MVKFEILAIFVKITDFEDMVKIFLQYVKVIRVSKRYKNQCGRITLAPLAILYLF